MASFTVLTAPVRGNVVDSPLANTRATALSAIANQKRRFKMQASLGANIALSPTAPLTRVSQILLGATFLALLAIQ